MDGPNLRHILPSARRPLSRELKINDRVLCPVVKRQFESGKNSLPKKTLLILFYSQAGETSFRDISSLTSLSLMDTENLSVM